MFTVWTYKNPVKRKAASIDEALGMVKADFYVSERLESYARANLADGNVTALNYGFNDALIAPAIELANAQRF